MNLNEKHYIELLHDIKVQIKQSQVKTVMAANAQMLWAYWSIGNRIIAEQEHIGWGHNVINKLSQDIQGEFPKLKGFSPRNLSYMRKFAILYPTPIVYEILALQNQDKESKQPWEFLLSNVQNIDNQISIILQPPVAKLGEIDFVNSLIAKVSWSHHIILMNKLKEYGQLIWYMLNTLENGISRDILDIQIKSKLYERQITNAKVNNFQQTLPQPDSDFANYMLKDPYLFDFVQAKEKADERNIEEQLTKHITKFLLELGRGFSFIGNQYKIVIDENEYFIDLLFYHVKLHCYIVVELKSRDFKPEDVGQINFYINVVNGQLKSAKDTDTIGLLLCKGKNNIVAEYALKGFNQPIGIAEYELSKAVPEQLKSDLPDITELERELETE